jgi:hypothetical protein
VKRLLRVQAREFNRRANVYIGRLTSGLCRKIVITKHGVPYFEIVLCVGERSCKKSGRKPR